MAEAEQLEAAIRASPKCEHHVHLEGALVGESMPRAIASTDGGAVGFEAFRRWFASARAAWDRDDDGQALRALLASTRSALLDERVVWITYNVSPWYYSTLGLDRLVHALQEFRSDAQASDLHVRFLLGARRSAQASELDAMISPLLRQHPDLFGGVDFQGNELADPTLDRFGELITAWQAMGASVRTHAGEFEHLGIERVRDAAAHQIREISHGVAAFASEPRPAPMVDSVAWFHVCPISNQVLGASQWWRSPAVYCPYLDRLTISTDDPAVFGCRLTDEFMLLHAHGASPATIRQLIGNGFRAAGLSAPQIATYEREIQRQFAERGLA